MSLSDYNGWTGNDREAADRRLKVAMRAGLYGDLKTMKDCPCSMCGAVGNNMLHAEEYGPSLDDYVASHRPMCAVCHGMLHLRFRFPGRWEQFKQGIRDGNVPRRVAHIGVVFGWARGWRDVPVSPTSSSDGCWWERLTCERYSGPRKILK